MGQALDVRESSGPSSSSKLVSEPEVRWVRGRLPLFFVNFMGASLLKVGSAAAAANADGLYGMY